uniref:C2 domain-containing protein n=1 Tax=Panagrolaimus davidi TaxID=227884 RepID=A0A914PQK1_9BILA
MQKRTGFARSEEVGVPDSLLMPAGGPGSNFQKQASKESTDSENWPHQATAMNDTAFGTFIEDLGKGQIVGRQVLASPVLGEIELTINLSKFGITVSINRGKNLTIRANVNNTPAPYVKLYLMDGKVCVCKAKTQPSRKTTAPVFGQAVEFQENFKHRTLQITVLGDCGRMERKLFMGIAQINLDKLSTLPQPVTSWYKLFHNSSLAPGLAPIRKDSENSLLGGQQQ